MKLNSSDLIIYLFQIIFLIWKYIMFSCLSAKKLHLEMISKRSTPWIHQTLNVNWESTAIKRSLIIYHNYSIWPHINKKKKNLTARKSFYIILLIFLMLPQLMQYNPRRAVVLPKRQEPMNILWNWPQPKIKYSLGRSNLLEPRVQLLPGQPSGI